MRVWEDVRCSVRDDCGGGGVERMGYERRDEGERGVG